MLDEFDEAGSGSRLQKLFHSDDGGNDHFREGDGMGQVAAMLDDHVVDLIDGAVLKRALSQLLLAQFQDAGEIEGLDGSGGEGFRKVDQGKDVDGGREKRDVRVGRLAEDVQGSDAVESKREKLDGRIELHDTESDLRQRIDERFERRVIGTRGGQHPTPQMERMDKLPVVDRLNGFLLVHCDGVMQMDGQLADVNESLLIGNDGIEQK